MKKALVTGSAGLVGSQAVKYYAKKGYEIIGIDNDTRGSLFGEEASTKKTNQLLKKEFKNYIPYNIDIRDNDKIKAVFKEHGPFNIIIHTAAQPSHDWAARDPYIDFSINATGTLVMLENFRKYSPDAVFILTSTNKVYGDRPNSLPLIEKETRYEVEPWHKYYKHGINESMSIDNSKHSLMGASKLAADILAQEYGKYFGLKTGIFRCGCITGPLHSGTMMHGFLAYLVKCIIHEIPYTIIGYKGKQVRDNIHAYDLITAFDHFINSPRPGEVYNMGGSRFSNTSIIEAIKIIEEMTGKKAILSFKKEPRKGDHIWYISDIRKFKKHYPGWRLSYNIKSIIKEIVDFHKNRN